MSKEFECLKVTRVEVTPLSNLMFETKLKGFADVELNNQLLLRGLRITKGEFCLWVSYPIDPFYKGEDYRSIYFPATKELRDEIENAVLEEFQKAVEK